MDIICPPRTSNQEFNLVKQRIVAELCYVHELDIFHLCKHDCRHLDAVHHPDLLWRARHSSVDGFGGLDYRKVMHAETSSQVMVEAASLAMELKAKNLPPVVFAPVSGFHHAGWNRNGGFCTFNGLMAAAFWAKMAGARNVLILDGDAHWGNGTQEIIDELKADWCHHVHIGQLDKWLKFRGGMDLSAFDLVLYQAGADCHIDDPCKLGTFTTGEFISRDRRVFDMAHEYRVPLVWNLAGGYSRKAVDLHTSTFQTACEIYYPGQDRPVIERASTRDWSEVVFPLGEETEFSLPSGALNHGSTKAE